VKLCRARSPTCGRDIGGAGPAGLCPGTREAFLPLPSAGEGGIQVRSRSSTCKRFLGRVGVGGDEAPPHSPQPSQGMGRAGVRVVTLPPPSPQPASGRGRGRGGNTNPVWGSQIRGLRAPATCCGTRSRSSRSARTATASVPAARSRGSGQWRAGGSRSRRRRTPRRDRSSGTPGGRGGGLR
jgi:hypothetical protein